ncbi:MAG: hypothetical protein FWB79_03975 [Treponema sp.]|nr:hypothetical protein [Treponema sp.]
MTVKAVGKAAVPLIFFLVLSSCGDMTTLFPSADSYLVRASVNGTPVEDGFPILRSGDRIYPYFATSVRDDPDVAGLLVYMRNQQGETLGYGIRFVLDSRGTRTGGEGDAQPETGDSILEIAVASFDQELPPFVLPEGMEIGHYTMVFEVFGNRAVLRRTELPVFYLGDAEFSLRDISMSLPGTFGSRLVPPGTKVLLEARLDFDARLDPYLIWHSGRNIISEGRARDGAGSVLWEAPDQTAFHPLRLEILPFTPPGNRRNFVGISREILLPVSATAEGAGFFFGTGEGHPARNRLAEGVFHLPPPEDDEVTPGAAELYRWYRFEGRLNDTVSAQDEDRFLVPGDENTPLWTSIGHSYGLSTGDNRAFLLSPVNFLGEDQSHGGGVFLFHFKSIAEGTIFSAFFPSDSPLGGAWIDLSRNGDTIVLRLGTAETTIEVPVFLSHIDLQTLIPAAVKFYIHPDHLEANLGLGEKALLQSAVHGVRLSDALTGEGIVRLGGEPLDSWTQAPTRIVTRLALVPDEESAGPTTPADADPSDSDRLEGEDGFTEWDEAEISLPALMETRVVDPSVTTVWNEFAVMFSSSPFPRPYFPEEDVPEDEGTPSAADATSPSHPTAPVGATPYGNTDASTALT